MSKNILNTLGASNLSEKERSELDYYGTNPKTLEALLDVEQFDRRVWESGSGHGNLTRVLIDRGYVPWSTDIHDYGCLRSNMDIIRNYIEKFKE